MHELSLKNEPFSESKPCYIPVADGRGESLAPPAQLANGAAEPEYRCCHAYLSFTEEARSRRRFEI